MKTVGFLELKLLYFPRRSVKYMVNTQYRSDVTNDTIEMSAIKTKQAPLADNSLISFVVVEQGKALARYLAETGGFSTADSQRNWRATFFPPVKLTKLLNCQETLLIKFEVSETRHRLLGVPSQ